MAPTRRGLVGALGTAAVVVLGAGTFLDGIFRLDCQGIDSGCSNDSWHSHAHKIESGVTAAAVLLALLLLPFVLRRVTDRRAHWLPMLAALPALFAANIAFSAFGDGAATRAGTVVAFAALAYAGYRLLRPVSLNQFAMMEGPPARAALPAIACSRLGGGCRDHAAFSSATSPISAGATVGTAFGFDSTNAAASAAPTSAAPASA